VLRSVSKILGTFSNLTDVMKCARFRIDLSTVKVFFGGCLKIACSRRKAKSSVTLLGLLVICTVCCLLTDFRNLFFDSMIFCYVRNVSKQVCIKSLEHA
jgi:hypothetical protein